MATATIPKLMTVEEFLALPDDGVDRELINGVVREKGMTVRNRHHSLTLMRLGRFLGNWIATLPGGPVELFGGEAGVIVDRTRGTTVGVDVALINWDLIDQSDTSTTMCDCIPTVAIEILSPSDTNGDVHEKIRLYLDHGVAAVWIVDPDDRSVRIYRRGQPLIFFNSEQTLVCEPELPGFSVHVSELFR